MRAAYKTALIRGGIIAVLLIIFYTIYRAMATQKVKESAGNDNVRAFLDMISKCEGTYNAGADGYRMLFGGSLFDVSNGWQHPERVIKKSGYSSSASGRYQFLKGTWRETKRNLGLKDFSPESQDLGAIERIRVRGALDDLIAGRFEAAVAKCGKEWASLPGSPYGQPVKTLAQAKQYYLTAGGAIA